MVESISKPAPLNKYKRTKMITTLGPSTDTYEEILAMLQAGANGVRLNCSHGSLDEKAIQITHAKKAANALAKPISIIMDLQGPKLRLGEFEGVISIKAGQQLSFSYKSDFEESKIIPLQYDLSKKIKRGDRLFLKDGSLKTTVTSVHEKVIHTRAENSGTIIKNQGVNVPDTDFAGDVLTEKDKEDVSFGASQQVDYIALSYVQSKKDLNNLKNLLKNLGSSAKIIAKIETKAAIDNLEEIIVESDAVMVARGDLAVETLPESVPLNQRRIIALSRLHAKPTIVATQLLGSMTNASEPTRAEVSDVATAVLLGADCLMLSDETAIGKNPLRATTILKKVIIYTEQNTPEVHYEPPINTGRQSAIASAIIALAKDVGASAIVAETKSGATALHISARRPSLPIVAVTSSATVANQLAIVYGIKSYLRPDDEQAAQKLTNWLHRNQILARGEVVVTCSGQYPGVVGTTDTIKVRVVE